MVTDSVLNKAEALISELLTFFKSDYFQFCINAGVDAIRYSRSQAWQKRCFQQGYAVPVHFVISQRLFGNNQTHAEQEQKEYMNSRISLVRFHAIWSCGSLKHPEIHQTCVKNHINPVNSDAGYYFITGGAII